MDQVTEKVNFSYSFTDKDDGALYTVNTVKEKECISADELCEMFLHFMTSAGYSEDNVWNYFKE